MNEFVMMPVPVDKFAALCAVLGAGVSLAALAAGSAPQSSTTQAGNGFGDALAASGTEQSSGNTDGSAAGGASVGTGPTATTGASPSDNGGDVEVDAGGHPWSPDLHASTKGKTKDGYWRMKVGVARPDPKPGFPKDAGGSSPATGTSTETGTNSATSQGATEPAGGQPATEDDDEFAAFREAAAASSATDTAAAASVPARTYTDADLSALCNQAAVKLGDPAPVKELIGQFVPAGQVVHSRSIPEDKRTDFVKAVEAKAGIEFAG